MLNYVNGFFHFFGKEKAELSHLPYFHGSAATSFYWDHICAIAQIVGEKQTNKTRYLVALDKELWYFISAEIVIVLGFLAV